MKRRNFIAAAVSLLLFVLFIPLHRTLSLFSRLKKPFSPNEHEIDTVTHIAEFIYPQDEEPGAAALGIKNYFTSQLRTSYYKEPLCAVQRLTKYLDGESLKKCGKTFLSSGRTMQQTLLQNTATNLTKQNQPELNKDFNTLIDITLEGCFCDPMHGGNKNRRAWRMLNGTINEEWFNV